MKDSPDDRSALAVAMEWASRVTTISLEMVIPGVLGHWADVWLETRPVLLVVGVILGFSTGIWHLVKLSKSPPVGTGSSSESFRTPQDRG